MDDAGRPCGCIPGSVRILGLDVDDVAVIVASLALSSAGDTYVEAVHVFDDERTRAVCAGLPSRCEHGYPVGALSDLVATTAKCAHALAFTVAPSLCRASLACGPILGLGIRLGMPVIPLDSADIARALTGQRDASAADVLLAIDARTLRLDRALASIRPTRYDAVVRAIAAAVVGLEELAHWRVPALPRSLRPVAPL